MFLLFHYMHHLSFDLYLQEWNFNQSSDFWIYNSTYIGIFNHPFVKLHPKPLRNTLNIIVIYCIGFFKNVQLIILFFFINRVTFLYNLLSNIIFKDLDCFQCLFIGINSRLCAWLFKWFCYVTNLNNFLHFLF